MGKEEIENFPLRIFVFFLKGKYFSLKEIKSSLKGYFRYILICKVICKY